MASTLSGDDNEVAVANAAAERRVERLERRWRPYFAIAAGAVALGGLGTLAWNVLSEVRSADPDESVEVRTGDTSSETLPRTTVEAGTSITVAERASPCAHLAAYPTRVAVADNGVIAVVVDDAGGARLDTLSLDCTSVVHSYDITGKPTGLAISPDGATTYLAVLESDSESEFGRIRRYVSDPAAGPAERRSRAINGGVFGLDISVDGSALYVLGNGVTKWDPQTLTLDSDVGPANGVSDASLSSIIEWSGDPTGAGRFLVLGAKGSVFVLDPATWSATPLEGCASSGYDVAAWAERVLVVGKDCVKVWRAVGANFTLEADLTEDFAYADVRRVSAIPTPEGPLAFFSGAAGEDVGWLFARYLDSDDHGILPTGTDRAVTALAQSPSGLLVVADQKERVQIFRMS